MNFKFCVLGFRKDWIYSCGIKQLGKDRNQVCCVVQYVTEPRMALLIHNNVAEVYIIERSLNHRLYGFFPDSPSESLLM